MRLRAAVALVWAVVAPAAALRVTGEFRSSETFSFLTKFGFQKTDAHSRRESFGYIYGNATSDDGSSARPGGPSVTLAVLDRELFLRLYAARSIGDGEAACKAMFAEVGAHAYDPSCSPKGQDYLRRTPCPAGRLCPDEDSPDNVLPGNQFTYVIQNLGRPRFWYVSMVACYRNATTCEWRHYDRPPGTTVRYDFRVVNGDPKLSAYNALLFQFSYDRQYTLELYLLFWACYVVLVPLQIYAVRSQRHPITKLFTCSLLLEFAALCLIVIHTVKFAFDGVGVRHFQIAGDVLDILSRTMFMLLLLLLAKGWAVTRLELTRKPFVFGVWACYGIVHILLYVWNMTEVDIIEEIDEFQTWPGWLMLSFRVLIMIWFVYELRNTMLYEHNMAKLNFLLHFGASSLVWFVYLPIIALIALQISPLWRYKFLLGITYSADCLAYCVMAHLLWPTRSEQYLLLTSSNFPGTDELDEFNESPHVVHGISEGSIPSDGPRGDGDPILREQNGDNADDDEVIFNALSINNEKHKLISDNVYG